MSGNKNKLIAFNYFGGKFTFIDELYEYFPCDFIHLVDLFAGSMVVSLNYDRNVIKTANEINGDITNFFFVLRDHYDDFINKLLLTPCSNQEYLNCWEKTDDKIEMARRFYVRVRQSFFGLGAQRRNKGWHMAKSQLNCTGGETVSRWNNAIDKLEDVVNVIRDNFQILNLDYSVCIDKTDTGQTFFYADPPYPLSCRKSKNDYRYEFSDDDHWQLSQKLHNIEGYAMISSYDNELYNELYHDWTKIPLTIKENNLRNNIRSPGSNETIWINYNPPVNKIKTNEKQLKLAI